ncbi:MAG TPA: HlyD family efflux transporter periplasmic adaptor subunit [Burkholderiaceae bacterium]|nr:HlyD family efflux transporter periplasmic adaptor subunit [Burkholderiaceae bacterium]
MNVPMSDASNERLQVGAPAPNTDLSAALEAWRSRLTAAGLSCSGAAFHSEDPHWTLGFSEGNPALLEAWNGLRARVSPENPVALGKVAPGAASALLMATSLHLPDHLPDGRPGIVGVVLAPPHNERSIQLVMLSLGWLQLALSATSLRHNQRAARLLELMGHVGSQREGRAAAQDWVNRTASWARAEAPQLDDLIFALFEVRNGRVHWWVGADTAWAEKASPAVQEAAEAATQAMVEMQEVRQGPWWAMPLLADGEPTAVVVARSAAPAWPDEGLNILRASAALAEPLLRHWKQAERALASHAAASARQAWRKLSQPGHLTWKAAAVGIVLALAVLLLWPVTDRVTANMVIEGRVRQVVTAPFEGFIAQVLVRPGERVTQGQVLARLDDRDLKLEQGKHRSEREQAEGKLRQAMAGAKLARTTLVAPLQGLVVTGDWAQQIGGPVESGKEMFEIAATDGYRVVLHVPDHDIARVKNGQPGALRLTGQPQASHAFKVTQVTATASVQDGTNGFRVEAAWAGPVPPLSPGMQGVGKIEVGEANLLTLWTRSSIDWLRLKLWSWWW